MFYVIGSDALMMMQIPMGGVPIHRVLLKTVTGVIRDGLSEKTAKGASRSEWS